MPGSTKFYSEHQIAMMMEQEGIGYLVQRYMSPDHIEDPELKATVITARQALDFIERRLSPHIYDEEERDDFDVCVLDNR